jgi:hypothetical protein
LAERHFIEHNLIETPFNRKVILPNRQLTERCLTKKSKYQNEGFFQQKGHLTESYFGRITFGQKEWAERHLTEISFILDDI